MPTSRSLSAPHRTTWHCTAPQYRTAPAHGDEMHGMLALLTPSCAVSTAAAPEAEPCGCNQHSPAHSPASVAKSMMYNRHSTSASAVPLAWLHHLLPRCALDCLIRHSIPAHKLVYWVHARRCIFLVCLPNLLHEHDKRSRTPALFLHVQPAWHRARQRQGQHGLLQHQHLQSPAGHASAAAYVSKPSWPQMASSMLRTCSSV